MRIVAFLYGVASYVLFLAVFLYAVGFVGDLVVPKTVDSGTVGPRAAAVAIDLLLLSVFATPHSVMARSGFKTWWTRIIPAAVERSTYVLTSSLLLGLLFWQWRPIPSVIWEVTSPLGVWLLRVVFSLGWAVVLLSTFLINHFDLFGLRQVYLYASGLVYTPIPFQTPGLYRYVRHPIMLGFLLAFWATHMMTVGHLLFAGATTAYVLVALRWEEHDLVSCYGERYEGYRQRARMLLPFPRFRSR